MDGPPEQKRRSQPVTWRNSAKWFVGYLVFALLTHTQPLHGILQTDDSLYQRFAQDWAKGSQLYIDRYEAKLPVVFWAFRSLGDWHPRLAYWLVWSTLTALAALTLRRGFASMPLAARAAPLLYITATALMPYSHLYGTFLTPFTTLAVACTARTVLVRSRFGWPFAGGIAFAIMLGLYPPYGVLAVALVPFLVWNVVRNGLTFSLVSVGSFVLGVSTLVGFVVLHAQINGYWDALLDAMSAITKYGRVDRVTWLHHFERWTMEIRTFAQNFGQLMAFLVVASLTTIVLAWRSLPTAGRVWFTVTVCWLLAVQVALIPGGRHFTQYYFPLTAPLAVLGAIGLAAVREPRRYRPAPQLVSLGFVLTVVGFHFLTNHREMLAVKRKSPEHLRTQIRYVADYLKAKIPANEPTVVSVWGPWAELYWLAPRPSPSRHIVPFNLTETRPEFFEEWAEDVLRNPPQWVIVDDSLFGPTVSEDVIRSRAGGFGGEALIGSPAFAKWRHEFRENYEMVTSSVNLYIMRRKPGR